MSEFWIRFTDDERIEGPFSVAELKKLASRGYLGPVDKIGNAYSGPWKTAGNIPRLGIAAPLEKEIDYDSIPKQKPPNDFLPPQDEAENEEQPLPRTDPLALSIDRKAFREDKLITYQNAKYPALAAAIRYYARSIKIVFLILRMLWWIESVIAVVVYLFYLSAAVNHSQSDVLILGTLIGGPVLALFLHGEWIAINLFYVLSMAWCEAMVAFLSIEKSVRTTSTHIELTDSIR